jgi:hypothetical protein
MTEPDEDRREFRERGDEAARQFRALEPEHGRLDLPERPAEERAIGRESGPGHYAEASWYARQAAEALRSGEVPRRLRRLLPSGRSTPPSPRPPRQQCKIA